MLPEMHSYHEPAENYHSESSDRGALQAAQQSHIIHLYNFKHAYEGI